MTPASSLLTLKNAAAWLPITHAKIVWDLFESIYRHFIESE